MELKEVKGAVSQPMRLMVQVSHSDGRGGTLTLRPPSPTWPGSVNTDLLRVHWECIFRIDRQRGGALLGCNH